MNRKERQMRKTLWAAAMGMTLAACGGGGSSGGSGFAAPAPVAQTHAPEPAPAPAPTPEPAPVPPPATAPVTRTFTYKAGMESGLPHPESFLRRANIEGGNGWREIGSFSFAPSDPRDPYPTIYSIFVKEGSTTYTYERPPFATTAAALQAQLDEQGARGFRFGGQKGEYRKTDGSAFTFSYRVLPVDVESSAELLAQAKAQGADGYHYHLGRTLQLSLGKVRIYEKESQGRSTYDYEVLPPVASEEEFFAQVNAQGARGFRFKGSPVFGAEGTKNFYEKDLSQSASFHFYALDYAIPEGSTNIDSHVAQANTEGAKGSVLVGPNVISGVRKTLYFTPANCSGHLCDPLSSSGL
jgi:hypothetical protein